VDPHAVSPGVDTRCQGSDRLFDAGPDTKPRKVAYCGLMGQACF